MSEHNDTSAGSEDARRKERVSMAREICMHRGENPDKIDRGGNADWEKYEPLAGAVIREAERLFKLRAAAQGTVVRLEARPADGGREWTEIFPSQLEWVATEGHQVRAIETASQPSPAAPVETKPFSAKKNLREVVAQVQADIEAAQSHSSAATVETTTKSAPALTAPHNSGERAPSSDAARVGADTNSSAGNVHAYVANYRFEIDGGGSYCPSQHEEAMIEDAIEGYIASLPQAPRVASEPAAWVNGDELDNLLDDRTTLIQSVKSGWRRTPLYRTPPQTAVWQPIETAPKDGTNVILGDESDPPMFVVAFWQGGSWLVEWDHEYFKDATRWMPIPSPSLTRPEHS